MNTRQWERESTSTCTSTSARPRSPHNPFPAWYLAETRRYQQQRGVIAPQTLEKAEITAPEPLESVTASDGVIVALHPELRAGRLGARARAKRMPELAPMALGDAVGDTKIANRELFCGELIGNSTNYSPTIQYIIALLRLNAAHSRLYNIDHLWPQSMQHSYATRLLQLQ